MIKFFAIASILVLPALIVSADDSGAVTEPIPLLLWAATDPTEDSEVAKIDAATFYRFTEKYREEFLDYYNSKNIIGATLFLKKNAEESGTSGVIWTKVFAKILLKQVTGQSEEKEHGVPSLAAWAIRNTGPGTSLASVERETLVSFILAHKQDILKFIKDGDVDGLIQYLESTKSESKSNDVDWKTVVTDLKDNRQLFKYSCGVLDLQLCDKLSN